MADVYYVSSQHTLQVPYAIKASSTRHLTSLAPLLKIFFKKANSEQDWDRPTVVVLSKEEQLLRPGKAKRPSSSYTELDVLSFDEKVLLLRYFFSHMNIIVLSSADLLSKEAVAALNAAIDKIDRLVKNRIARVATWTGTGIYINDFYSRVESLTAEVHVEISNILSTMSFDVNHHSSISPATEQQIVALKAAIVRSIDFQLLLENRDESHLRKLCHCVGHWAFPAHELSNDDLLYCVVLILGFALNHISATGVPAGLEMPTPNELLAFVYMTRDIYRNGNPFHNFRHAADVIQACFHYLIRLKCLPEFEQLEKDPRSDETKILNDSRPTVPCVELVALASEETKPPLLNPLQSLGLLVAALGHDVGHPGVTNAFMIKHAAPTSQLFGERSVLELFHASVFTNKILSINWPSLLLVETNPESSLYLKHLIIDSILATDMAEHFEYIHKLKEYQSNDGVQTNAKVKLISSLLIKCADISNVTRPVRVSSQWALVLSREFEEIEVLEGAISAADGDFKDMSYPKLPSDLDEVLKLSPMIHKGQLFFIQTFAEGLFKCIVEYFPELQFTADIIGENMKFWLDRAASQ